MHPTAHQPHEGTFMEMAQRLDAPLLNPHGVVHAMHGGLAAPSAYQSSIWGAGCTSEALPCQHL